MKQPCPKCGTLTELNRMKNHVRFCKGTLLNEEPEVVKVDEVSEKIITPKEETESDESIDTRKEIKPSKVYFASFPTEEMIDAACRITGLDRSCVAMLDDSVFESTEISIPLTACPPELAYLHENRQYYLTVAGRKIGDRFIIEETKMMR